MALGEQLKKARLDRKMTASQVAAATRMKVQLVEAIEREDFSQIAAPVYGKGFIKLYAEEVKLDPKPLLNEYMACFVAPKTPSLKKGLERTQDGGSADEAAGAKGQGKALDLFSQLDESGEEQGGAAEATPVLPAGPEKPPVGRVAAQALSGFWQNTRERVAVSAARLQQGFIAAWARRKTSLRMIRFSESPAKFVFATLGILVIAIFVISGLSRCVSRQDQAAAVVDEQVHEELRVAIEPPDPYFD